ncbi:hypothetical protein CK934_05115 [Chitinophaga sp. MD30]|nr:hypothetical protein CK934_05115 [Chitinophaga sp. MD30]
MSVAASEPAIWPERRYSYYMIKVLQWDVDNPGFTGGFKIPSQDWDGLLYTTTLKKNLECFVFITPLSCGRCFQ